MSAEGHLSPHQFKHLYHESPMANRESIRSKGLIPGPGVKFTLGDAAPPGTYLSRHGYSEYGSSMHDAPHYGYDRWRVHTEGLEVHPDPTHSGSAFFTPHHIPPERLKLVKKGDPDWQKNI